MCIRDRRGQLHLLEGQLAAAVSGKQGPPAVAHLPAVRLFATLRRVGFAGVKAQAKAKKEYKKLFPGKAMPADRFADVELSLIHIYRQ